MNKKVKGISFIVLGMFLTYLLVNRRGIEASNNSEGNFLFLFLNFFTLLTGKMAWIIIGLIFVAGLAYLIKKEVKISRKKELTGAICLLAISLLFIREDIVTPLPNSFTDAGGERAWLTSTVSGRRPSLLWVMPMVPPDRRAHV